MKLFFFCFLSCLCGRSYFSYKWHDIIFCGHCSHIFLSVLIYLLLQTLPQKYVCRLLISTSVPFGQIQGQHSGFIWRFCFQKGVSSGESTPVLHILAQLGSPLIYYSRRTPNGSAESYLKA